jgi:asparagine synthase (glutamine-hydrolysing)
MCGITGYITKNNSLIPDNRVAIKMIESQKHRGPDDSGLVAFNLKEATAEEVNFRSTSKMSEPYNGMLGFNRLSILDLSKNGHQPMMSEDKKVILTLNGEIYNAFDFRDTLIQKGYKFKSTSDTEVVLKLYHEYGFDAMIKMLNGMFAIVLIDLRKHKIYLARDRFGIKPLYLYQSSEVFAFSSELKSFLHLPGFKAQLDNDLLDEFLLFRGLINKTLIRGVELLQPGSYLELNPSMEVNKKTFFDINDYQRQNGSGSNIDQAFGKLEDQLNKAVKSQLISDVKLGCQLSGGVDSSLVTNYASNCVEKGTLETISIVFEDQRFSEEKYVNQVAETLDLKAHKFNLDSQYYFEVISKASWHLEQPINHPNSVGIYLLSQHAKQHVTVLLSGEGADETFGGYSRFSKIQNPYTFRQIASGLKNNRGHLLEYLRWYTKPNLRAIMASSFLNNSLARELNPNFNTDRALEQRLDIYNRTTGSDFDRQVKYELQSYLPELLIRQDKMSMAHSIENRVPFLDNDVVAQSFSISEQFLLPDKARNIKNSEKYLLKKIAAKYFGNSFAFRDKMGFGIPLRTFLKSNAFRTLIHDSLLPGIRERGVFNAKTLSKWYENIDKLPFTKVEALWVMFSFEIWAKQFLDYENSYT